MRKLGRCLGLGLERWPVRPLAAIPQVRSSGLPLGLGYIIGNESVKAREPRYRVHPDD